MCKRILHVLYSQPFQLPLHANNPAMRTDHEANVPMDELLEQDVTGSFRVSQNH